MKSFNRDSSQNKSSRLLCESLTRGCITALHQITSRRWQRGLARHILTERLLVSGRQRIVTPLSPPTKRKPCIHDMSSWCVLDQKWAILRNSFQGNNSRFYQNEEKVLSSLVEGVFFSPHTRLSSRNLWFKSHTVTLQTSSQFLFTSLDSLFQKILLEKPCERKPSFSSLITWASLKTPISTEFKNSLLTTMLSHGRKEPLKCLLW